MIRRFGLTITISVLLAGTLAFGQGLSSQVLQLLSRTNTWTGQQTFDPSGGLTLADGAPSTTTNKVYRVGGTLYFNGQVLSTTGVGTLQPHALLGAGHNDSVAQTVSRGSLIYGDANSLWNELVVGAAGTVVRSNGTDVLWSTDGSALTALNATNLGSGTVPLARLANLTNAEIAAAAAIAWTKISKTGSSLADLTTRSAGDLSSGTLADARLSTAVSLLGQTIESSEITNATIVFADWASNSCSVNQIPKWNGSAWACAADTGGGTVTSVALSVPGIFVLSGSPITTSGTLSVTLANETANTAWMGPTTGSAAAPTFRALVDADVPDTITIAGTNNVTWASVSKTGSSLADLVTRAISDTTGTLATARGGTGITTAAVNRFLRTSAPDVWAAGQIVDADVPNDITIDGTNNVTWVSVNKAGSSLADLTTRSASALATGTLADARLSANVSLLGQTIESAEITNATIVFADWASNSCANDNIPKWNGSAWVCAADEGAGSGGGTVTSVGLALPAIFTISGSPVTTSGTLTGTLATQTNNLVWSGPATAPAAAPTFRALVDADVPDTITIAGTNTVTWASVNKSGSSLADLATRSASDIATGTLDDARLSANVSLLGSSISSSEITDATIVFADWASNSCALNEIPKWNGAAWACAADAGSGTGTVTSVGLALPAIFTISGSPVTTSGTLTGTLATQTENLVWAGPATAPAAAPTFRSVVDADIPDTITIAGTNNVTWASVSKSGSSLADLATRSASDISSGTLSATYGGTGLTGFTATNRIPYAASASALTTDADLIFDGTELAVGGALTAGNRVASYGDATHKAGWFGTADGNTGLSMYNFDTEGNDTGQILGLNAAGNSYNPIQIRARDGLQLFLSTTSGFVGINNIDPGYSLEIGGTAAGPESPTVALSDDDVTHGLTTLAQTDVFSHWTLLSASAGGAEWTAISDTDAQALSIRGVIGSTNPTDTTPAIKLIGGKASGTTIGDLGAAETVLQIANNDDSAAVTVLGNRTVGIANGTFSTPGGSSSLPAADFAMLAGSSGANSELYVRDHLIVTGGNDPIDLLMRNYTTADGLHGSTQGFNAVGTFGTILGWLRGETLTDYTVPTWQGVSAIRLAVEEKWWQGALDGSGNSSITNTLTGGIGGNVHPGNIQFMTYPAFIDTAIERMRLTAWGTLFIGGGGWSGNDPYGVVGGGNSDCLGSDNGTYPRTTASGCVSTVNIRGGGLRLRAVDAPESLTCQVVGTPGSTLYTYAVVAIDAADNKRPETATVAVANGPATMSATNYVQCRWVGVSGAESYCLARNAGAGFANECISPNAVRGASCRDNYGRPTASLTRSGTTATLEITGNHGFNTGDAIVVAGVTNDTNWNATWSSITKVDGDTVTFTVPGTLTSPATGASITAALSAPECYISGNGPNGTNDQYHIRADGSTKIVRDQYTLTRTVGVPDRNLTADLRVDGAVVLGRVAQSQLTGGVTETINGMMAWCTDCNANSSPCTVGGTGALAVVSGGSWRCLNIP